MPCVLVIGWAVDSMKASYLFKKNIETLLSKRGHTRHDLAFYCRRSDAWLSKILGNSDRNLPLKYLDRIAEFFGLAAYQLFQPGISPLTERRAGHERREGGDRRISGRRRDLPSSPIRQIAVTPDDEALLEELHELDYETYQRVKAWITVARLGAGSGRKTPPRGAPPAEGAPPLRRGRGARVTKRGRREPPKPDAD